MKRKDQTRSAQRQNFPSSETSTRAGNPVDLEDAPMTREYLSYVQKNEISILIVIFIIIEIAVVSFAIKPFIEARQEKRRKSASVTDKQSIVKDLQKEVRTNSNSIKAHYR